MIKTLNNLKQIQEAIVDWIVIFSEISGEDYTVIYDIYNTPENELTPEMKKKLMNAYNKVIIQPTNAPKPILPFISIAIGGEETKFLHSNNDRKFKIQNITFHLYAYGKRSGVYLENLMWSLFLEEGKEFLDRKDIAIIESSDIKFIPDLVEEALYQERYGLDIEVRRIDILEKKTETIADIELEKDLQY